MVPLPFTLASVPVSLLTGCSCSCAAATSAEAASIAAANAAARCIVNTPAIAASSLGRRHRHRLVLQRLVHMGRVVFALPFADHNGGDRVAHHVGGAAAHVEELIDADDQEQAGLGDVE